MSAAVDSIVVGIPRVVGAVTMSVVVGTIVVVVAMVAVMSAAVDSIVVGIPRVAGAVITSVVVGTIVVVAAMSVAADSTVVVTGAVSRVEVAVAGVLVGPAAVMTAAMARGSVAGATNDPMIVDRRAARDRRTNAAPAATIAGRGVGTVPHPPLARRWIRASNRNSRRRSPVRNSTVRCGVRCAR